MLSENNKKTLLALARATLEEYVKHQNIPTLEQLGMTLHAALTEKHGAFVTLYFHSATTPKALRGCIGTIQPVQPLYQAVINNTVNACSRDGRFIPVSEIELKNIRLEINVLTVPCPITSYHDIRLGHDGIILSRGQHQAVFLPSVPLEWRWDLSETLRQLALKAGLMAEAWQEEETRFEVFQSEFFSE